MPDVRTDRSGFMDLMMNGPQDLDEIISRVDLTPKKKPKKQMVSTPTSTTIVLTDLEDTYV